jgi:hypothetical protein
MTDFRPAERRKERRYIVCGVQSLIDGRPCQIVDISRSGVRLLLPHGVEGDDRPHDIDFRIDGDDGPLSYRVVGRVVRRNEIAAVFRYEPPCDGWEDILRAFDTFEMTRLSAF